MSLHDKKIIVLRQLSQEAEAISLSDLILILGKDYKERSVRRWLNLLVADGAVKKIGEKRGTKYLATKQLDESKGDFSSCFTSASLQVIKTLEKPLFERMPITYMDTWIDGYKPGIDYYLSKTVRRQLRASGERANAHDPAGTYAHRIFNRLIIDLSYNSSRLEGNTYSLLDTEKLLLHGDSAEGKLDEEKIMILNHKEAIRYLVEKSPQVQITKNTICTLHYLLSDGLIESSQSGKVRKHGVRIGGSTYIPFEDKKKLEHHLDKIATKASFIEDPYEQSIFLLIHVSYLQAFIDVNKRTARLCANIPLIKKNLVPLAFNDVRIADYMSAMIAVYELQDVRPLVDLYVYSYMRTCAAYDSTVKALGFDEVRVQYRQVRREMIRQIILDKLTGQPMQNFLFKESKRLVLENAQAAFLEDTLEDLALLDESRLAGLGISLKELEEWQKIQKKISNKSSRLNMGP